MRSRTTHWTVALALTLSATLASACSSSDDGSKSGSGGSGGSGASGGNSGSGGGATCASGPTGAGCNDTTCPCTLLTQKQISDVLGVQVGPPDDGTGPGGGDPHACVWTYSVTSPSAGKLFVEIDGNLGDISDDCATPSGGGFTITPASEIGERACYTSGPGISSSVMTDLKFSKNCYGYDLSITATGSLEASYSTDTIEAYEKTLALDVVSKF